MVINGKEIKPSEKANSERDLRGMEEKGRQVICALVTRHSPNGHAECKEPRIASLRERVMGRGRGVLPELPELPKTMAGASDGRDPQVRWGQPQGARRGRRGSQRVTRGTWNRVGRSPGGRPWEAPGGHGTPGRGSAERGLCWQRHLERLGAARTPAFARGCVANVISHCSPSATPDLSTTSWEPFFLPMFS